MTRRKATAVGATGSDTGGGTGRQLVVVCLMAGIAMGAFGALRGTLTTRDVVKDRPRAASASSPGAASPSASSPGRAQGVAGLAAAVPDEAIRGKLPPVLVASAATALLALGVRRRRRERDDGFQRDATTLEVVDTVRLGKDSLALVAVPGGHVLLGRSAAGVQVLHSTAPAATSDAPAAAAPAAPAAQPPARVRRRPDASAATDEAPPQATVQPPPREAPEDFRARMTRPSAGRPQEADDPFLAKLLATMGAGEALGEASPEAAPPETDGREAEPFVAGFSLGAAAENTPPRAANALADALGRAQSDATRGPEPAAGAEAPLSRGVDRVAAPDADAWRRLLTDPPPAPRATGTDAIAPRTHGIARYGRGPTRM